MDIVIATPGKLVEYIKTNPSFNIQNLQYLVVDEADKLLLQSFDNWIHVVYNQHTQSIVDSMKLPHPRSNVLMVFIASRAAAIVLQLRMDRFQKYGEFGNCYYQQL